MRRSGEILQPIGDLRRHQFVHQRASRIQRDQRRVAAARRFGRFVEALSIRLRGECRWLSPAGDAILVTMSESLAERLEFALKASALARNQAELAGNLATQAVLIQMAEEYEREAEGLKHRMKVAGVS